jgi:Leucine-rich repeat (LRR) protein
MSSPANKVSDQEQDKEVKRRIKEWEIRQAADPLSTLHLSYMKLSKMPKIPEYCLILDIAHNKLTKLSCDLLPANLQELRVSYNLLTSIDVLPSTLIELDVSYNQLSRINMLPVTLQDFTCSNNHLITIPSLPENLYFFNATNNFLYHLPKLPLRLIHCYCGKNNLLRLPTIPPSVARLEVWDNEYLHIPNYLFHRHSPTPNYNRAALKIQHCFRSYMRRQFMKQLQSFRDVNSIIGAYCY